MSSSEKIHINFLWFLKTTGPLLIIGILILSVLSSFEAVLNGYLLGGLAKLNSNNLANAGKFLLMAACAYAITYISLYFFLIVKQFAIQKLNTALKLEFFNSSFTQGLQGNAESSEVINNVLSKSQQIEGQYFTPLILGVQTLTTVISSLIFVLYNSIPLGIIYLLMSTLTFIPSIIGGKKMSENTSNWSSSNETLVKNMTDTFRGRFEILNFGVFRTFHDLIKNSLNKEELNYRKLNTFQFLIQLVAWLLVIVSYIGPIAIGLWFASNGWFNIQISTVIALSLTADRVVNDIRELTSFQNTIKSTQELRKFSSYNVDNLLDESNNIPSENDNNAALSINDIVVNRGDKQILKDISLSLPANSKIIISGPSGVGKSTLLNTISGQIIPESGSITFNNRNISYHDYSYISQFSWLFTGSIRDNLTLFQSFSDEQLINALTLVGLNKEFGDNPLDFIISNEGTNISGGQKQRLAIARGILRHTPVFLLDEITASLDPENANSIRQFLYKLPATIIEITHNPNLELAKDNNIQLYQLRDGKLNMA